MTCDLTVVYPPTDILLEVALITINLILKCMNNLLLYTLSNANMLSSPLGLGYQPRVVLFRKKRTKEQKIQPVTQTLPYQIV